MPTAGSIRIRIPLKITFQNDSVSAVQMAEVLQTVNEAVYDEEIAELQQLALAFADLPPVALDAALYRIEHRELDAVFVESVSSGCIVLTGSIVLIALYILKQTLGETIKDAWKEDEWHQKLKRYLTENLERRCRGIANEIERRLHALKRSLFRKRHFKLDARAEVLIQQDFVSIAIQVKLSGQSFPPPELAPPIISEVKPKPSRKFDLD